MYRKWWLNVVAIRKFCRGYSKTRSWLVSFCKGRKEYFRSFYGADYVGK